MGAFSRLASAFRMSTARKHKVKNDDVELVLRGHPEPLDTVRSGLYLKPLRAEPDGDSSEHLDIAYLPDGAAFSGWSHPRREQWKRQSDNFGRAGRGMRVLVIDGESPAELIRTSFRCDRVSRSRWTTNKEEDTMQKRKKTTIITTLAILGGLGWKA